MNIRLQWISRTHGATKTVIYRSDTPFEIDALPEPVGEVGPGITEFLDTGLDYGKPYYYRTEVFKGEESSISFLKELYALPYTGPGPQELIAGDTDYGYFGLVSEFEVIRFSHFQRDIGKVLSLSYGSHYSNNDGYWYAKFIYEGRVLYCPLWRMEMSGNYQPIFNSGLYTGMYEGDVVNPGNYDIGSPVIMSYNGHRFLARLPTDNNVPANYTDSTNFRRNSEFYDAYLSIWDSSAIRNRLVRRPLVYPTDAPTISYSHSSGSYAPVANFQSEPYFVRASDLMFYYPYSTSRSMFVPILLELLPNE